MNNNGSTHVGIEPTLSGTVVVNFQIDGKGGVLEAQAKGLSETIASCVAKAIRSIRFPKPKRGTVAARYPFTFSPPAK